MRKLGLITEPFSVEVLCAKMISDVRRNNYWGLQITFANEFWLQFFVTLTRIKLLLKIVLS